MEEHLKMNQRGCNENEEDRLEITYVIVCQKVTKVVKY